MYIIVATASLILIIRYFNLLPKFSSKFWGYVDTLIIATAFLILLSRLPAFVAGVVLTVSVFVAYKKGYFNFK